MPEDYPFVSIVMPVRNEGDYIEKSLGAVLSQNYPKNRMEIIVADGMSTDKTREIIKKLQKEHPLLKIIDNPQGIVAPGLNAAIRSAQGDIIIRADGHCEIAADYVSQCVKTLKNPAWDVVGGPIETIGETRVARAIAVAMSSWFGVGGSAFRTIRNKEMEADTVPFPAYRKEIFLKAGYFDEELVRNQDDEHNYRIRKMGGKIFLNPKIKSRYYSRGTLKSLWLQYCQYGYWKVRVMQKHPKQMSLRQFVPVLLVGILACSLISALFFKKAFALFCFFACIYLIVNTAVSLFAVFKLRTPDALYLPAIYSILHFSYGLGFFRGLLKFKNRW